CRLFLLLASLMTAPDSFAQDSAGYQRPPQDITDILDAPPTPLVSLSPTREYLLLIDRESYPPIADVAAPMLRLAGERIDPRTNGPHLAPRGKGLTLQKIADNSRRGIDLPADSNVGTPNWSPDGNLIAFPITTKTGI